MLKSILLAGALAGVSVNSVAAQEVTTTHGNWQIQMHDDGTGVTALTSAVAGSNEPAAVLAIDYSLNIEQGTCRRELLVRQPEPLETFEVLEFEVDGGQRRQMSEGASSLILVSMEASEESGLLEAFIPGITATLIVANFDGDEAQTSFSLVGFQNSTIEAQILCENLLEVNAPEGNYY